MKLSLFHIIILCTTLTGCGNQAKKQYGSIMEAEVISLKDPTVMHSDTSFLDLNHLYLIDDQWLFHQEGIHDRTVYANQIKGDSLLFQTVFVKPGRGPSEMHDRGQFYQPSENELIFGTVANGVKLFRLKNKTPKNILDLHQWESVNLFPPNFFVAGFTPLNENKLLLTTMGDTPSILAQYTPHDTNSLKYLPFPYPKEADNLNTPTKTMQYYGKTFTKPSGDQFIYSSQTGAIIFIAEIQNDTLSNIRYLFNEPIIIEGRNYAKGTRIGLLNINTTDNYIYILEPHDTFDRLGNKETNEGYPLSAGKEIYVFDWNGNPIKRILLDHYLTDFVIDSKDEKLYGSTMDLDTEDAYVIRYDLK